MRLPFETTPPLDDDSIIMPSGADECDWPRQPELPRLSNYLLTLLLATEDILVLEGFALYEFFAALPSDLLILDTQVIHMWRSIKCIVAMRTPPPDCDSLPLAQFGYFGGRYWYLAPAWFDVFETELKDRLAQTVGGRQVTVNHHKATDVTHVNVAHLTRVKVES